MTAMLGPVELGGIHGFGNSDGIGIGNREDQGVSPHSVQRWGFEMNSFTSNVKKKTNSSSPHTPCAAGAAGKELQVIPNSRLFPIPTQMPLNTPGKAAGGFVYLHSWSSLTDSAL